MSFTVLLFIGQSCTTPKPETPTAVDSPSTISISSFEECIAAGNPVMESYPRQCRTDKGILFTEILEENLVEPIILAPTDGSVDGVTHTGPEDTVIIEEPTVSTPPIVQPLPEPEPQDSPEAIVETVVHENPDYDVVEPQDSMEVDIDNVNWGDGDTTYDETSYEDTSADPNACSPEGAVDVTAGNTYYCLDGIWTHEDYVY